MTEVPVVMANRGCRERQSFADLTAPERRELTDFIL
jgi:hypothetical protein